MPPLAVLIEAFTEHPGGGNGAAVVRLEEPASAAWMQGLAATLRQSETAFLLPWRGEWLLRWFTPTCEVPLCGHATLAAALALGHWGQLPPGGSTRLHSRSGPLPVSRDGSEPWMASLELPGGGLRLAPCPPALERLLKERLRFSPQAFWSSELGYRVALLPAEAPLELLGGIAPLLEGDLRRGLVLMQPMAPPEEAAPGEAPATEPASGEPHAGEPSGGKSLAGRGPRVAGREPDYRLRFFAPGLGIEEDPVTGSAHALVAPWWMERLGKASVVGWQCSDRPGGMVCEAPSSGMIRLIGSGQLLWDGTLGSEPPPQGGNSPFDSGNGAEALRTWLAGDSPP